MKFDLENFSVDEFSDGSKLSEWISENYLTQDAELPGLSKRRRSTGSVLVLFTYRLNKITDYY